MRFGSHFAFSCLDLVGDVCCFPATIATLQTVDLVVFG